jgi:ATP-dependent protease ClpP protease subunit
MPRFNRTERRSRVRAYPGPAASKRGADDAPASRSWEIAICGELTDKHGDLVDKLIDVPRRSSGTIYFDSCGGNVYAGLSLATIIRMRGLRATAVVTGECSSSTLLPFAACEKRLVTPVSTFLFHPLRWHSEEDVRIEEATEWARHFKDLEADIDQLLSALLPLEMPVLQTWTRPGRFVRGSELIALGLAEPLDILHPRAGG